MTTRIVIQVHLKISARSGYSENTIMDRDINCDVTPGRDPADYLTQICQEEANKVKKAFDQFPQYLALPAPTEEV